VEEVDGFSWPQMLFLTYDLYPRTRYRQESSIALWCCRWGFQVPTSSHKPKARHSATLASHHSHNFKKRFALPPSSPPPPRPLPDPSHDNPLSECRLAPCSILLADYPRSQVVGTNQESLCPTRSSKRNSNAARYVVIVCLLVCVHAPVHKDTAGTRDRHVFSVCGYVSCSFC